MQRDYLHGEHINQDWWIVKLEIQGDYTIDRIKEFAGHMNLVTKKYANSDAIIRIAHGVKHKPDCVIHMNQARRCLRFFVYNISKRECALTVMEALRKTCEFFSIEHKNLILRPKPALKIITPDRIEVRGQAHGRRSL